ncbi:MAG: hypothetical protein FH759_00695 [Sediminimonas qiaohouensis]|uniref:Regulator of SigK n=1 Tax=Sediminimonas qiaohouensis TaxID=552061 RepID=A0A7C9L6B9_9RHOB|nr:anti-sigma factor [Sediminimonas qiaohouensis]MTJ03195.1 hypothetical protein [Sediminimonas qiaohouensis]
MSGETDPEDDRVLAGEYALGLLSPEEARAFEERMSAEPALRELYAGWAEDLAALTDDVEEVAPPADMPARIETALFGAAPRRSLWQRLGLTWIIPGAVLASLLTFFVVSNDLLVLDGDVPPLRAEIAAQDDSLRVLAAYDADDGALRVTRDAGAAAPGRALELWLIAGQAAPVSLGVLPEARDGVLQVAPELAEKLPGATLAISDEPPGGSPTGAPTGDVLATGQVPSQGA